jgi:hypothetical protein
MKNSIGPADLPGKRTPEARIHGHDTVQILIQHETGNLFLAGNGEWTAKWQHALSFPSTITALQFCIHHRLRHVLLFVCYQNPELDFTIAPFSEQAAHEPGHSSTLQESFHLRAQNAKLLEENKLLREELNRAVAESRERRQQRPRHLSFRLAPTKPAPAPIPDVEGMPRNNRRSSCDGNEQAA